MTFYRDKLIEALRALADHGLRCPEDLSVLGVDDMSTAAFLLPRLSTMAQPLEAVGAAAATELIARIQRPDDVHAPEILFQMELKTRESTGKPPSGAHISATRALPARMSCPAPSVAVALAR